jgi:hypothetical protein
MTSLLGSLVERSMRAPSTAVDPGPSLDSAPHREREGSPPDNSPPGAIVPRRRSRYEQPAAQPELDIAEESSDATAYTPPPQPRHPEALAAVRRVPAQRQRAARAASDASPHHAAVEPAPPAQPADAPPREEPPAASPRPLEPSRLTASADHAARSSTSRPNEAVPRREGVSPIRADAAAATVSLPAPAPERSSAGELAPVPFPRPGPALAEHIAAPPSSMPPAEPAAARRGELAPLRQRDPLRDAVRRSDPSGARLSIAGPPAPSVRVSIGRVEVRAVFASPPSPARRPAAAPTLALDDYLQQREKGA